MLQFRVTNTNYNGQGDSLSGLWENVRSDVTLESLEQVGQNLRRLNPAIIFEIREVANA